MTISASSDTSSYIFECSCGEKYNSVNAAWHCRKCRNYCVFGYCTHVIDIRTGAVVRGFEPSAERYAVAAASYERRLEKETQELEEMERAFDAEQQWLEEVARRGEEQAAKEAAEAEEDRLFELQDKMLGLM